jgi:uncharacterized damage-inducible protein DinB
MKNIVHAIAGIGFIPFLLMFAEPVTGQVAINADELKTQMIADWQRAKAYTNEYLGSMPADKYSYRAHDSVRSFAQQMLHLAQANLFFLGTATGTSQSFGRNLEQSRSALSADSVKYFVNTSYDNVIDGITRLDANRLGEKVSMRNMEGSRLTWLSKAFEHQTHHRGQTTIYIRLLGIKPPPERLF